MEFSKSGRRAAVFGRVQKILIFLHGGCPCPTLPPPKSPWEEVNVLRSLACIGECYPRPSTKLQWSSRIYDEDEGGVISRREGLIRAQNDQTSTQLLESKAVQKLRYPREGAASCFGKFWLPGISRGDGHSCTNSMNSNIKGRERYLKYFSRRFENVTKHMCYVLKLTGSPSRVLKGLVEISVFEMSLYLCMEHMCYRWYRWTFPLS